MSLGVPRAKCHVPSCAVSPSLDTSLVLSLSLVTAGRWRMDVKKCRDVVGPSRVVVYATSRLLRGE